MSNIDRIEIFSLCIDGQRSERRGNLRCAQSDGRRRSSRLDSVFLVSRLAFSLSEMDESHRQGIAIDECQSVSCSTVRRVVQLDTVFHSAVRIFRPRLDERTRTIDRLWVFSSRFARCSSPPCSRVLLVTRLLFHLDRLDPTNATVQLNYEPFDYDCQRPTASTNRYAPGDDEKTKIFSSNEIRILFSFRRTWTKIVGGICPSIRSADGTLSTPFLDESSGGKRSGLSRRGRVER